MRIRTKAFWGMALSVTFFSCSTSRFQQGFSYQPEHQAPDMTFTPSVIHTAPATEVLKYEEPISIALLPTTISASNLAEVPSAEASLPTRENVSETIESTDARQAVGLVSAELTEQLGIRLTEKQEMKAEKLVNRWKRKQQDPSNVDWAPRSNMEIFTLGAAAVGLLVGLFSPLGWFVFLVAALAYLYLKLLKK